MTEVAIMSDYQKMYYLLVHGITDALEMIPAQPDTLEASYILRRALTDAEDIYIETADSTE